MLNDFTYHAADFKKAVKISLLNNGDTESLMNEIFEDRYEPKDLVVTEGDTYYALFFTVSFTENHMASYYDYLFIKNELSDHFYENGTMIQDDCLICVYTNKRKRKDFKAVKKDNILFLSNGIGDLMIIYKLLLSFVQEKEIKVVVIDNDRNVGNKIVTLLKLCNNDIRYVCMDNAVFSSIYDNVVLSGSFQECYLVDVRETKTDYGYRAKFNNEYIHYYEFVKRIIGDYPEYDVSNEQIMKKLYQIMSSEEKKSIDHLLSRRQGKMIGIQFYTNPRMIDERILSEEAVLSLCTGVKNDNTLINLTKYPTDEYQNVIFDYDVSGLSIFGMMYLITKLDLVICIDSCSGHIASFFEVPSITIWNDCNVINDIVHMMWNPYKRNLSYVSFNSEIDASEIRKLAESIVNK